MTVIQYNEGVFPLSQSPEQGRIELLEQRVAELEETVHYLFNTLGIRGALTDTEVGVGRRMLDSARKGRAEAGSRELRFKN